MMLLYNLKKKKILTKLLTFLDLCTLITRIKLIVFLNFNNFKEEIASHAELYLPFNEINVITVF